MESQTRLKKRNAQKCVKMTKTIFGKVRKALGNMSALTSEKGLVGSREARAEQFNLTKVGRFWWFLRNSRQHFHHHCHCRFSLPFSDVTAGCATIFGHVWISRFLIFFLRIFVRFLKYEFQIRFSPVFFHHMMKSTSDRCSTPFKIRTQRFLSFKTNLQIIASWHFWTRLHQLFLNLVPHATFEITVKKVGAKWEFRFYKINSSLYGVQAYLVRRHTN